MSTRAMRDPRLQIADLTDAQCAFLDLYGLKIESVRFQPEGVIRTLAAALEQAGRSTFIEVKRADGLAPDWRCSLSLSASIDNWLDVTEGLRNDPKRMDFKTSTPRSPGHPEVFLVPVVEDPR